MERAGINLDQLLALLVNDGAGGDLTEALDSASHGADLLARVPVIGVLADEPASSRPD